MPPYIYHILHVVGILMVFMGYGALLARSLAKSENKSVKKLGSITSGIGLILILVAGFGLIAKMGYSMTTPWILVKLVVWLILGGLIALINRLPGLAWLLWWVLIALGGVAAYMVYARPI
ncbi:hypothetical protein [Coraliomargarita akajimensis]|uniref:Uncharacterized protein n=1 Tax=Coraliomargarita akajimensis (strain DSM 45221 / IAM 15411 / JCM 23193 / KCTC 12865 / 04OKA010-24) TaxID=583355 RepID=D5EIS7_CORAD|nr:hypothetical protein [Coraliomargarita akajimensis]ADE54326.1 conserved hypothetical protein [Coraliomargarita akajimensis DSM 45221]